MNAPAGSAPRPGPTATSERIHALDAMRGVAILGVLVAYTVWSLGNPPEATWSRADRIVATGMDLLVDGKFLTMFAGLFGVGIAQQWRRWQVALEDPAPLHLRRMGFLLAVGLLHAVFLRNGDILVPYALCGFALLAFRRVSNVGAAVAAVLVFALAQLVLAAVHAWKLPWPERPGAVAGGYLAENLAWLRYWYSTQPLVWWPQTLAVVLAGFIVGRAGWIERLVASRALAGRTLGVALSLAVLVRVVLALRPAWTAQRGGSILQQAGTWALATAYASAIILVTSSARGTALLAPLRALGRMAFTNYLLQALLIVPYCLLFGVFDHVTPTRGLAIAAVVAVIQVAFSVWWLRRRPIGPLEWVWRRVTYGPGAR